MTHDILNLMSPCSLFLCFKKISCMLQHFFHSRLFTGNYLQQWHVSLFCWLLKYLLQCSKHTSYFLQNVCLMFVWNCLEVFVSSAYTVCLPCFNLMWILEVLVERNTVSMIWCIFCDRCRRSSTVTWQQSLSTTLTSTPTFVECPPSFRPCTPWNITTGWSVHRTEVASFLKEWVSADILFLLPL